MPCNVPGSVTKETTLNVFEFYVNAVQSCKIDGDAMKEKQIESIDKTFTFTFSVEHPFNSLGHTQIPQCEADRRGNPACSGQVKNGAGCNLMDAVIKIWIGDNNAFVLESVLSDLYDAAGKGATCKTIGNKEVELAVPARLLIGGGSISGTLHTTDNDIPIQAEASVGEGESGEGNPWYPGHSWTVPVTCMQQSSRSGGGKNNGIISFTDETYQNWKEGVNGATFAKYCEEQQGAGSKYVSNLKQATGKHFCCKAVNEQPIDDTFPDPAPGGSCGAVLSLFKRTAQGNKGYASFGCNDLRGPQRCLKGGTVDEYWGAQQIPTSIGAMCALAEMGKVFQSKPGYYCKTFNLAEFPYSSSSIQASIDATTAFVESMIQNYSQAVYTQLQNEFAKKVEYEKQKLGGKCKATHVTINNLSISSPTAINPKFIDNF